ncbi:hypothetical protein HPB50_028964 [Hyalomma asiaticum]|nr:hypothetical protein HPB50_028964 [Hyalomma asiaticum]
MPKRPRRRKVKAKISFGSTSSGNRSLPSHLQASVNDDITVLETAQKGEEEPQSGVPITATPESRSTTGKNCDDSVHRSSPVVEDNNVGTPTVVDPQSSVVGDHEVARSHKREPKSLSDTDVMDIVRSMRQLLLAKGPLQENELANVVSPTQAKLVREVQESMTAFLSRHPGFVVVHEDLYSFVYYEDPEVEGEDRSTSQTEHEVITGPSSSGSTNSGGQDAAASDGGPDGATISSSRPPHQSTTEGEQHEEEKRALKDAGMQEKYPPRSRAMRSRRKKSKAKSRREWCQDSKIAETRSTNENRDSDVVHRQRKQQAPKRSPEKVHQPRENLGGRPRVPRPGSWCSAAVQKKSPAKKEVKHASAKANVVKPRPSVSKPHEPPGVEMQAAASSSEIASVLPTKEETAKKSQIEEKLSRIARMAKDRRPDIPEKEIRMKIDHLRKSRGGLSGLTYNEIVALVLELFDARDQETDEGKVS